ncbi:hypothetical protein [Chryseobacterium sp. Leaf394]|uniref:hypothetical protein n=1 Tax=Chryseobacterium sp. Leaf394 TaxID=1736361 RepID=UPI000FF88C6D|nr:hypothetical protein [Chryseobacterium sp. Leaf394]
MVYSMSPDWKIMNDFNGRVLFKNSVATTSDWKSVYVYSDDFQLVTSTIEECISKKKVFELEHRVVLADGNPG